MQIKAVTFDVGGTLIEPWPSVGHVYAEVAARHGIKAFSPEQLNARFKTAWRARQGFGHSRAEWAELVDEVFGETNPDSASKRFFAELFERFAQPEVWRIFDDVLPALDTLASREIKLAVISNWDERLRGLLHSLKLDRYFEAFAISCEVGFSKPSPVIFEHAAAKLGLPADSILHIGDSFEMDIAGARTAGWHAWQIQRTKEKSADPHLVSLAQLAAKIEELEADD